VAKPEDAAPEEAEGPDAVAVPGEDALADAPLGVDDCAPAAIGEVLCNRIVHGVMSADVDIKAIRLVTETAVQQNVFVVLGVGDKCGIHFGIKLPNQGARKLTTRVTTEGTCEPYGAAFLPGTTSRSNACRTES